MSSPVRPRYRDNLLVCLIHAAGLQVPTRISRGCFANLLRNDCTCISLCSFLQGSGREIWPSPGNGHHFIITCYSLVSSTLLRHICCALKIEEISKCTLNMNHHFLPAQVRNRIYELVLSVPPTRRRDRKVIVEWRPPSKGKPYSVLAILQTCARIYEEAEGIFYSINPILCFTGRTTTQDKLRIRFLHNTCSQTLRALEHLTIDCIWTPEDFAKIVEMVIHHAPQLVYLHCIVDSNFPKFAAKLSIRKMASAISNMPQLKEVKLFAPVVPYESFPVSPTPRRQLFQGMCSQEVYGYHELDWPLVLYPH